MPYFITNESTECPEWAVVKEDGEVLACHDIEESAIAQMVAVSQAEGIEPGGTFERQDRQVSRDLPDAYRPANSEDVPEGRACGNCLFYREEEQNEAGLSYCTKWEEYVRGDYYCDAWEAEERNDPSTPAEPEEQIEGSDENEPGSAKGAGGDIKLSERTKTALRNKAEEHNEKMEEEDKPAYTRTTYGQLAAVYRRGAGAFSTSHRPGTSRAQWAMARVNAYLYLLRNGRPENENYVTDNDLLPEAHPKSTRSAEDMETREVNLTPPAYMRASARRGLEWYEEGLAGDGLVDATVREARAMAEGNVTADKWVRLRAWIARHIGDLDSPDADPSSDNYPSAGVVAMALWGGGTTKRSAQRAMDYADGVVSRIEEENEGRATGAALSKFEQRVMVSDLEIRSENGMTLEGYAAVFNSRSENLGGFTEQIAEGAFTATLKARNDIKLLWNHDTANVLGSTRAGTLQLTEDSRGLRVKAELPDTNLGRDIAYLVKRGDIDSFSFGFSVNEDSWNSAGNERTLESVRLFEVSLVSFPAYSATAGTATVRGIDQLAKRADVDADQLADALLKVEGGETISTEQKEMLSKVINTLSPEEAEEQGEEFDAEAWVELKKKKLEYLKKKA